MSFDGAGLRWSQSRGNTTGVALCSGVRYWPSNRPAGLTQQAFCLARGLSTSVFYNAKARLKESDSGGALVPLSEFVAVSVEPSTPEPSSFAPAWDVKLTLSAGMVLRARRASGGE
jgi:hypothetical protein